MIKKKKQTTIERLAKIPIDYVLDQYTKSNDKYIFIQGYNVKRNSERYKTFKEKGTKCVTCGLEGKFFALEKHKSSKNPHFNLYGIDTEGNEVMMTKDHIIPKSKGGKNYIDNYQTMCSICNCKKGNGEALQFTTKKYHRIVANIDTDVRNVYMFQIGDRESEGPVDGFIIHRIERAKDTKIEVFQNCKTFIVNGDNLYEKISSKTSMKRKHYHKILKKQNLI